MNKNISVWRGEKTPPTKYHLWQKNDTIYVNIEDEWQSLASVQSIIQLEEVITNLNRIKDIELVEVNASNNNILKSYRLKSGDNYFGTTIDIPKDRAIKDIKLGYQNASVNSETGEITIGTGTNPQYMIYSIALEDGSYKMINIDLSQFITEKEYKDGLELVDNSLQVKIDKNSDPQLTVSSNGIKLEGVQDKFNSLDTDIVGINNILYSQFLSCNIDNVFPTQIEYGVETTIQINLSFYFANQLIDPNTLRVGTSAFINNIEMVKSSIGVYKGTIKLSSNSTIYITYTYKGISKSLSIPIIAIVPSFIGVGEDSNIKIASNKYLIKSLDYTYTTDSNTDNYLWLYLPNTLPFNRLESYGIEVPIVKTGTSTPYSIYRSYYTIGTGTKTFILK